MDKYIDYFCVGFCILHLLISLIFSFFSGKRFERICTKCLKPVLKGEEHSCVPLSDEQLVKLVEFIQVLRGDGDAS